MASGSTNGLNGSTNGQGVPFHGPLSPMAVGDTVFLTILRENGQRVSVAMDPTTAPDLVVELMRILQGRDPLALKLLLSSLNRKFTPPL